METPEPGGHEAATYRRVLVDRLVERDLCRSIEVERAMRDVPREVFVPGLSLPEAYEDTPQVLKVSGGMVVSTISQPAMIAIMLDLTRIRPGDRVLEIGTGSGYNAALLAHLVGPDGLVVSIDVYPDLVRSARRALDRVGVTNAALLAADGRRGWSPGAPYDVIEFTVGARTVPTWWPDQLADGGRLLVPMLATDRLLVWQRDGDDLVEIARTPARFVPMQ